jgi:short-subunit dehydrogenase
MKQSQRCALVTGASSGIGAAFARHLAAEGYSLVLVARRRERLEQLADEIRQKSAVRCEVIAADLGLPDAPRQIHAEVEARGLTVDFLVNNAGLSGNGAFVETPWSELASEIQVMITALTELTHLFAPGMKKRAWGRIVNVSSIAAFQPPGAGLLYTGIKSYVLNLSQAVDMELKPFGVHVCALCPGFTHTEFHDVMGTKETATALPKMLWQTAEEVVVAGYDAVMAGEPVCVPGTVNKLLVASVRPLPESIRYRLGRSLNPFKKRQLG